jgi:hypothetical protein
MNEGILFFCCVVDQQTVNAVSSRGSTNISGALKVMGFFSRYFKHVFSIM